MVLVCFPLVCLSSVISFVGGFFLGDLEAREEIAYYYREINTYITRKTYTQIRLQ